MRESKLIGWGGRIRTCDHGIKTRCLTAWLRPNAQQMFYIARARAVRKPTLADNCLIEALMDIAILAQKFKVGRNHLLDQLRKRGAVLPTKNILCLGRIPQQKVNFSWPEIPRIDRNEFVTGRRVDPNFIDARTTPFDNTPDFGKGQFHEFANRMGFARGENKIIRSVLLQDAPHALNIVSSMPPIALGIDVAQKQF